MTHLHELTVPFHTELRLGAQLDLTPQFAEFNVHLDVITPQPATGGSGSDRSKQRTTLTATLLDKQGAERKDQEFIIASFSHDTITHENVSVRFPVLRAYGGGYRLRLKMMNAAGNNKGAEDAAPFDASIVLHGVQQTMLTATQIKALQQQNAAAKK